MKKKETIWQLLKRLDEEAATYNSHLTEVNRYFDSAAKKTRNVLYRHEEDLHKTIGKLRKAIRKFSKKKKHKR